MMSFNFLLLLALMSLVSAASRDQDLKDLKDIKEPVPDGLYTWLPLPTNDTSLVSYFDTLRPQILADTFPGVGSDNPADIGKYHLHIQRAGIYRLYGGTLYNATFDIDQPEGGVNHGPLIAQCTVNFNIVIVEQVLGPYLQKLRCRFPHNSLKVPVDLLKDPKPVDSSNDLDDIFQWQPLPVNDTKLVSKIAKLKPEIIEKALKSYVADADKNQTTIDGLKCAAHYHLHITKAYILLMEGATAFNASLDIDRPAPGEEHGPVVLQCNVSLSVYYITGGVEIGPTLDDIKCKTPQDFVTVKAPQGFLKDVGYLKDLKPLNKSKVDSALFTDLAPTDTALTTRITALKSAILARAHPLIDPKQLNASDYEFYILQGSVFAAPDQTQYLSSVIISPVVPNGVSLTCQVDFSTFQFFPSELTGPILDDLNCKAVGKPSKKEDLKDSDHDPVPVPPNHPQLVDWLRKLKSEIFSKALGDLSINVSTAFRNPKDLIGVVYYNLNFTIVNSVVPAKPLKQCKARISQVVVPNAKVELREISCTDPKSEFYLY